MCLRCSVTLGARTSITKSAGEPGFSAAFAAKLDQVVLQMQKELTSVSSNSIQIITKDLDYCFPCGWPVHIVEAIHKVIEADQKHGRLTAP